MEPATTYPTIVADGIGALSQLSAALQERLDRRVAEPEEVLRLRDIQGLLIRLVGTTPEEWRIGGALFSFTGQDFHVLSELADSLGISSRARDDAGEIPWRVQSGQLRALRDFLMQ